MAPVLVLAESCLDMASGVGGGESRGIPKRGVVVWYEVIRSGAGREEKKESG